MPIKISPARRRAGTYRAALPAGELRGSTGTTDKALRASGLQPNTGARAWRRHLEGPKAILTMAQAAIALPGRPTSRRRSLAKIEDHWRGHRASRRNHARGRSGDPLFQLYPRGGRAPPGTCR